MAKYHYNNDSYEIQIFDNIIDNIKKERENI